MQSTIYADTRHLSKVRRWAARKRGIHACVTCRNKKIKCSDFRPCVRCTNTKELCIDNEPAPKSSNLLTRAQSFSLETENLLKKTETNFNFNQQQSNIGPEQFQPNENDFILNVSKHPIPQKFCKSSIQY